MVVRVSVRSTRTLLAGRTAEAGVEEGVLATQFGRLVQGGEDDPSGGITEDGIWSTRLELGESKLSNVERPAFPVVHVTVRLGRRGPWLLAGLEDDLARTM